MGAESGVPTAAGLSPADLIGILSIVVVIFGLLLTAVGVLLLRVIASLNDRISEVKSDAANAVILSRQEYSSDLAAVWRELGLIRMAVWGGTTPDGPTPSRTFVTLRTPSGKDP